MAKQEVVAQFPFAAVKKRANVDGYASFDIWRWNPYKLKWVRMHNHGCGFGEFANACTSAIQVSDETANMLKANQKIPPPLE